MKPVWQTSQFLGTYTERTNVSLQVTANAGTGTVFYSLISGQLPIGLNFSAAGLISGIPSGVGEKLSSQFVVRATDTNSNDITDQNFVIDIQGTSDITWITPEGFIGIGLEGQPYVINQTPVDYQFLATPGQVSNTLSVPAESLFNTIYLTTTTNIDIGYPGIWRTITGDGIPVGTTVTSVSQVFNPEFNGYAVGISQSTEKFIPSGTVVTVYDNLPQGQELKYYLTANSNIPEKLTLDSNGRLSGFVDVNLPVSVSAGVSRKIPKIYQFGVIATNGISSITRNFNVLVVDPSNLSVDTTGLVNTSITTDASTITPLFWRTKSELGTVRDRNQQLIQLEIFDPYPSLSSGRYEVVAKGEVRWEPATRYQAGDIVVYIPGNYYYMGLWDPNTNSPELKNGDTGAFPNQKFSVTAPGAHNFGNGIEYYQKGDFIIYDGRQWNKVSSADNSYICIESHVSTVAFDINKWNRNQFPPYFKLDSKTGTLYASLPYIPIYRETYFFVVKYSKQDLLKGTLSTTVKSFSLSIEGEISNPIKFISGENLGTIGIGYPSELQIVAKHDLAGIPVKFKLSGGKLPTGLTLTAEGNITGQIIPGTTPGQYSFKIEASDYYQQRVEQGFFIVVEDFDVADYYKVYATSYNQKSVTQKYKKLVNDPNIFKPEFIYRKDDLNYGIPAEARVYLSYGLEQINSDHYAIAISKLGIKNTLQVNIGELIIYLAKDANQQVIYEVLAAKIVDATGNQLLEIKQVLESIETVAGQIKLDNYQAPTYTRTIQENTGIEPITELHLVLAYTLPGKASQIVKKLGKLDEKFIDFPLNFDRIVLENLKNSQDTQYLYLKS